MHTIGQHYHIYNRGAHKAPIFLDKNDYWRFIKLLFIANDCKRVHLSGLKKDEVFSYVRTDTLVDISAYCLMPNHFHILMVEKVNKGIALFMQKLCTAYSMYYNKKYCHSGTIFQGQYKSKHVDSEEYRLYLIQYIHLNPFGINEPNLMKNAKPEYIKQAIEYSKKYEYSSYRDYLGENRAQANILARVDLKVYP